MSYFGNDTANKALKEFGSTKLKPDSDEISKGNLIVDKVFKVLQRSRYPPARCVFGGSIGKATAIPGSDYDLVVFVNNIDLLNFEYILNEYELVLKTNFPDIKALTTTTHSVQLQLDDNEFDLLPAVNYVSGFNNLGGDALAEEQANRALQKIQELYRTKPRSIYDYSSCLVEYHVLFMKRQSAFVHELARICKFWSKTLVIGKKISGQSTIMELVATYAGKLEESTQVAPLMIRAFQIFLQQIKNMDSMAIRFETAGRILYVSPPTFQRPFLIEPSNPFNNFARKIDTETMYKLKTFAAETLRRLESDIYNLGYFPLELLFEAQPKIREQIPGLSPTKTLVGVVDCVKKNPTMIVRNEKKFTSAVDALQRTLKMILFTSVHAFTSTDKPDMTDVQVQDFAKIPIDRHACGVASRTYLAGSAADKHDDYDVTYEIPFANKPKAVFVSFCWE